MKTVSSTEAKARLNALLAEVETTGQAVTITSRGRPVAVLSPSVLEQRVSGSFAGILELPEDFDDPLADTDLDLWEGRG